LLHEFGHCFGAWLMGGGADRVMLWPLGGLATVRGAERSPYNEFVITLLGPLTTLVLALSATILLWILPGDIVQTAVGREFALFLLQMKIFNWVTFLFNMMIPLFPMDCARLIRSLLSMKFNPQRVTYDLCLAGLFVGGMMVLLFVFSNAGLELPGLQWFTSLISNASVFFLLIAVFGINACMIQLKEIQYAEVYNAPWEGKELVEAWGNTLRDLFRVRPRRGAKVAPPFPQPVAAGKMQARGKTSNPAPQTKPSRALTERERLAAELDDAVKREDFLRAAKIRDQLRGLNDKDDGQP
ncbi:UvrB/UvrC motif-containing protein, partial [Candidatus Sumerlaeota bacterium]|nr:UvrB/UvrC motif-containing protein [Candidatus Sumerlaeota bacterium]